MTIIVALNILTVAIAVVFAVVAVRELADQTKTLDRIADSLADRDLDRVITQTEYDCDRELNWR